MVHSCAPCCRYTQHDFSDFCDTAFLASCDLVCGIVTSQHHSLPSVFKPAKHPTSVFCCLRQPQVCLSVPGIFEKANLSPLALKQLFLLLLNKFYFDRVHIYTEGSASCSSFTGAVVPYDAISFMFKLSHITASTAAELAAHQGASLVT